jgi:predicted transcriptional regulator of viral defense system
MIDVSFLQQERFIAFSTREYALYSGVSIAAATKRLTRLATSGGLVLVTRGTWANTAHPFYSPYCLVPVLLGNEHGYISFLTALHRGGIISQIPTSIQVATTGRARVLNSPIGRFEFYHMNVSMFRGGIEWADTKVKYLLATPEKSLLDSFYMATRKGRKFFRLPELELEQFDSKKFRILLSAQITELKIKNAIIRRCQKLNLPLLQSKKIRQVSQE